MAEQSSTALAAATAIATPPDHAATAWLLALDAPPPPPTALAAPPAQLPPAAAALSAAAAQPLASLALEKQRRADGPLPRLLLLALSPQPRQALLSASLAALSAELASFPEQPLNEAQWAQAALQALRRAAPAALAGWAASLAGGSSEAAGGAAASLLRSPAMAATLGDSLELALAAEPMGGRPALYGALHRLISQQSSEGVREPSVAGLALATVTLQDAVVTLAEATAAAYIALARGDAAPDAPAGSTEDTSESAELAPVAAAPPASPLLTALARRSLLLPSLRSTRSLERFRNEVSLRRLLSSVFDGVRDMFEDRQSLFALADGGRLVRTAVPLPRRGELDALVGFRRGVSYCLEAGDLVVPLLQRALRRAGGWVSFLLVQLIGRALGLVAKGIRQSLSGEPR